jgi:hypothetical protein
VLEMNIELSCPLPSVLMSEMLYFGISDYSSTIIEWFVDDCWTQQAYLKCVFHSIFEK